MFSSLNKKKTAGAIRLKNTVSIVWLRECRKLPSSGGQKSDSPLDHHLAARAAKGKESKRGTG
jgi:hypothetical protein